MAEEHFHPYQDLDVELRQDPQGAGMFFLAVGTDPKASVVTLVGYNGEPGRAIKRTEWAKWKVIER